jgi:hypothetical protein
MILEEDIVSLKGIRLVPAGHEVTRSLIVRLNSIAGGIRGGRAVPREGAEMNACML